LIFLLATAFLCTISFSPVFGFGFTFTFDHVLRDVFNKLFAYNQDALSHQAFPHGPLAFLQYPLPLGNNYTYALLFHGVIGFLVSAILLFYNRRQGGSPLQGILIVITVLLVRIPLFVLVFLLPHTFQGRWRLGAWIGAAILVSTGILMRAYLGISLLALYYGVWLGFILDGGKLLSWKSLLPAFFPWISLGLMWMALFASVNGVIIFLKGQLYLAMGSSVATSLYPDNSLFLLLLFLFILTGVFIMAWRSGFYSYVLPLSFWTLLTLKYAFSREDAGHLQALFEVLVFLGLFIGMFFQKRRWLSLTLCLGGIITFSLLAKYAVGLNRFVTNDFHPVVFLQRLLRPTVSEAQYQQDWESATTNAPSLVDSQAVAYPWNHLLTESLPPPVVQAYAAYHPYLDARNAAYFADAKAPPRLILHPGSYQSIRDPLGVDDNYLWNVAPLSRTAIWENYSAPKPFTPRAKLDYTVWHRRSKTLTLDTLTKRVDTLHLNQWYSHPIRDGQMLFFSGSIQHTLLGQIQSLMKSPGLFVEYALQDGTFRRYRLNPLNWENGYLLQPFHDPLHQRIVEVDSVKVAALQSRAFQKSIPIQLMKLEATPLAFAQYLSRLEMGHLSSIQLKKGAVYDTCLNIPQGASYLDISLRSVRKGRCRATLLVESGQKRETFYFNRMPSAPGQVKSDYFEWEPGRDREICLTLRNSAVPIVIEELSVGMFCK
jgi:hypothetical protein